MSPLTGRTVETQFPKNNHMMNIPVLSKRKTLTKPGDLVIVMSGTGRGCLGVVRNAKHGYYVVLIRTKSMGLRIRSRERLLARKISELVKQASQKYPQNVRLRHFLPPGWVPINKRRSDLTMYSSSRWKAAPRSLVSTAAPQIAEEEWRYSMSESESEISDASSLSEDGGKNAFNDIGDLSRDHIRDSIAMTRISAIQNVDECSASSSDDDEETFHRRVQETCDRVRCWIECNSLHTSSTHASMLSQHANDSTSIAERRNGTFAATLRAVHFNEIERFSRNILGLPTGWIVTRPHLWKVVRARGVVPVAYVRAVARSLPSLNVDVAAEILREWKSKEGWRCWTSVDRPPSRDKTDEILSKLVPRSLCNRCKAYTTPMPLVVREDDGSAQFVIPESDEGINTTCDFLRTMPRSGQYIIAKVKRQKLCVSAVARISTT